MKKGSQLSIHVEEGHERIHRRRMILHKITFNFKRNVVFNTMVQLAFFTKPTTKISSVSVKRWCHHHNGVFLLISRIIMICKKGIIEIIPLILCAVGASYIYIYIYIYIYGVNETLSCFIMYKLSLCAEWMQREKWQHRKIHSRTQHLMPMSGQC